MFVLKSSVTSCCIIDIIYYCIVIEFYLIRGAKTHAWISKNIIADNHYLPIDLHRGVMMTYEIIACVLCVL